MIKGKQYQDMLDVLADDYVNADKIAMSIVNEHTPEAYAINRNYAAFEIEKGLQIDTSFTLYDRHTVERLIREKEILLPKPRVDIPKDRRWNRQHIRDQITQGVLQGDSIPNIAKRLQKVAQMDKAAAIRNARTAVTGAENAGRVDGYKRAQEMGIDIQQEWLASLDMKTRHSHRQMDGVRVNVGQKFPNGLRYPGDPEGPPEEVYNCRCTLVAALTGFDFSGMPRRNKLNGMSYEEWKNEKQQGQAPEENVPDIYGKAGNMPQRPRRRDFDDSDAFEKARENYKAEKAKVESQVSRWFDENYDRKTITDAELSEWVKNNGVTIYGSLDGLDRSALKAYTERYEKLSRDFPQVKQYHDRMGIPFEIAYTPNRAYDAEATHGMTFGGPMSNYKQCVISQYAESTTGGMVRGANPALRTFDHEFGHQLYFSMRNVGIEDTPEEFRKIQDMRKDFMQSVYQKDGMSEYATSNEDELFAEAFAAFYGGEKTAFANAMGSFLRRWGVVK